MNAVLNAGRKLNLKEAKARDAEGLPILTRRNAGWCQCRILQEIGDGFARVQFVDNGHTTVTMYFWEKAEAAS